MNFNIKKSILLVSLLTVSSTTLASGYFLPTTPIIQSNLLGDPLNPVANSSAAFDININFDASLSASQQAIFGVAESFWENTISGYKAGIGLTGFTIDADGPFIDGAGGVLGSAGPTFGTNQGGYLLTTQGVMSFDSADLTNMENNGSLLDVIKHEMGHVIGIGTLWELNNVYTDGTGEYTGAEGLAAHQAEFDATATFVPVELGGGPGTANGHWDEVDGGVGLTGLTDALGRDMRDELMTGWISNSEMFLSNTSRGSLGDLGFTITAVPVPAAIWLFASALGLMGVSKRRRIE